LGDALRGQIDPHAALERETTQSVQHTRIVAVREVAVKTELRARGIIFVIRTMGNS
jgi:hypothetical protein